MQLYVLDILMFALLYLHYIIDCCLIKYGAAYSAHDPLIRRPFCVTLFKLSFLKKTCKYVILLTYLRFGLTRPLHKGVVPNSVLL